MELQEFKQTALLDTNVSFAIENGLWLNATQVAKTYGKAIQDYFRLEDTVEYMHELSLGVTPDLKSVVQGKGKEQGTYIHPDLVMHFARWISPKFAIACDKFLKQELVNQHILKTEEANKEIARLKAQKKLVNIYDGKITSARGLVQHTDITQNESQVKETMWFNKLIEPEHKVVKTWKPTKKGLEQGIVMVDEYGTCLYDISKATELLDNSPMMEE